MAKVQRYEDLIAWQKAYALVMTVYRVTRGFPPEEKFGLTAQLRHAGVGIPSNIAEGFGRQTRGDFLRFLDMARGSAHEVQTQLRIGFDLGFMPDETSALDDVAEVIKMLNGLIASLRAKSDTTGH